MPSKYPNQEIGLSAQYRLTNFYESFGFASQGEVYLEDEIEHIKMTLIPQEFQKYFYQWRFGIHPLFLLGGIISVGIIGSSFIKDVDLSLIG